MFGVVKEYESWAREVQKRVLVEVEKSLKKGSSLNLDKLVGDAPDIGTIPDGICQRGVSPYLVNALKLLENCLCYVEWDDGRGGTIKGVYTRQPKFFASTPEYEGDVYLAMQKNPKLQLNIKELSRGSVYAMRVDYKKGAVKVIRPKSGIKLDRVIPLFVIDSVQEVLGELLTKHVLALTYKRDNGVVRQLCTTFAENVLNEVNKDTNYVMKQLRLSLGLERVNLCGYIVLRSSLNGVMLVPDLECSLYDPTGVRYVNLSRIIKIEVVKTSTQLNLKNKHLDYSLVEQNFYMWYKSLSQSEKEQVMAYFREDETTCESNIYEIVKRAKLKYGTRVYEWLYGFKKEGVGYGCYN